MCGKKGLSTTEGDGGTECELSDGRWVCSAECWDRAVEPAPSVAVKAGDAAAKLQRALDAASPSHKTMWVYVDDLRAALSAQVQDESEIIDCLTSGKPFVFDPATNFCHADDGGTPEHGIKYVPAAQVQDVAGWQPADEAPRGTVALIRHRSGQIDYVYKTNNGEPFPETWRYAGTANHGQQAPWPEYYLPISTLPAAPAKQEG
ncbi:hypothetical protein L905_19035 [Agrobacterium sp. TS43]|nr:hypothetical protein K538_06990 [Agrobacterium tumefaciens GW4]KVK49486.1 hypothetical protein L903_19385 [Agrobacterium sp. JL28]KVK49723.1 hypothetical protein L904_19375 [Agrobacterium sp. LY4]KVK62666.1 hypothetical protein L906_18510 [Agrobacterium sp. TS45]KVK65051.1 hypothetical protein L905_19035 [Agrobacterium sp. TS43]KVK67116.1 hypothetical protein L907_18485 [Agrobacterium sp. C13]